MTETPNTPAENISEDNQHSTEFTDVNYETLKDLCKNNADYFTKDASENGQRLHSSFLLIKDTIDTIWPTVLELRNVVSKYDFDEKTPGNGCRSFLIVIDYAILHGIQINKKVCLKRDGVLFRKSTLTKEVESCASLLTSLEALGNLVKNVMTMAKNDELFPTEAAAPEDLLMKSNDISQYCFYGRSLGFQFCESIRPIVRFVALSMVIFSEAYYSRGSFLSKARNSVTTTAKYLTDPEERAKRIVNISQNANIDFCKSFWFLAESELMKQVPTVVGHNVAISKIIQIPPEPLTLTIDNKDIDIPIPTSHIGKRPVQVRLISYEVREGMIGEGQTKNKILPRSRGLLVHCHGGGFIAQSSLSHDSYLRQWAKQLEVPILSIDYSLAPQAPYPRALEEITYAYCWALKNHELLGSTGERIAVAGDSAGGNMLLGTSLKCLEMGVPVPCGIFLAYTPTWLTLAPSPSRLLCIMDPLLPLGFIMRCLKAYIAPNLRKNRQNGEVSGENNSDTESFEEISQSDLVELQAHKSPISETSDTITYGSLSSPTADDAKDTVRHIDISDIDLNASDCDQSTSQNVNVSDFLEKYVLETDGTKIAVLKQETISTSQDYESTLQSRVSSIVANLRCRIGSWVTARRSGAEVFLDTDRERNLLEDCQFTAPSDPFLSPYLASDEVLKKLPPIKILSVHMDPCLDDCVFFAKKLRKLGNSVSMDILDGLPHGFLNFALLSKEANEGSKVCMLRIAELLDLGSLPSSQNES